MKDGESMEATEVMIQKEAQRRLIDAREHLNGLIDLLGANRKIPIMKIIDQHAKFHAEHEAFVKLIDALVEKHNAELDREKAENAKKAKNHETTVFRCFT